MRSLFGVNKKCSHSFPKGFVHHIKACKSKKARAVAGIWNTCGAPPHHRNSEHIDILCYLCKLCSAKQMQVSFMG